MKTILITIARGSVAKNLLDTDFYAYLATHFKLIILTPAHKDERFLKQYARDGVSFLPLPVLKISKMAEILFFFHKHLIYNSTVNKKSRWGIVGDPLSKKPIYVVYVVKYVIFSVLSHVRVLRDIARAIDRYCFQRDSVRAYCSLLREHAVSCIVSTGMTDDNEVALIKAARETNVLSIGFPKSWDNLSKHGFRAKTDRLVVWNAFMKEQALQFQNYKDDEVVCVGIPQHDFNFKDGMLVSREAYCRMYGLDPAKKIVLFGSEGKLFPTDTVVAQMIADVIDAQRETMPMQLIIRPHYGYKNDEKKFASLAGRTHVFVDLQNTPSTSFRDAWDYSHEFTQRFVNGMYHADIVINTASTITLDAICFDTPVINTAIDGYTREPYHRSVERWYETHYFQKVLSYDATTLVRSYDELTEALVSYCHTPSDKHAQRLKLREDFCYKYDGQAGMRFAKYVEYVTLQSTDTV